MFLLKYEYLIIFILIQSFCIQLAFFISSSKFTNINNNNNNNNRKYSTSQLNDISNLNNNKNDNNFKDEKIFDYKDQSKVNSKFVSEFVARIRGGIRQAKKLAKQFNLKLIRRVFQDSNYFLFQYEYQNQIDSFKLHQEKNKDVLYDYEDDYLDDVNCIQSNNKTCLDKIRPKRIRRSSLDKNSKRVKRRSLEVDELNKLKKEPSVRITFFLNLLKVILQFVKIKIKDRMD
jgi:hypothetical protein